MRYKKPGLIASFALVLGAVVALGGIYLTLSPPQPAPHRPAPVEVPVLTAPPEATTPIMPPPALQPVPPGSSPESAAVGDERAQPEAITTTPIIPAPEVPSPVPQGHPVIAIIIDDMGLDLKNSKRAAMLPAAVTLSYMPYAPGLHDQTQAASDQGHELMLHMPMEPLGRDDPGPGALLVGLQPDEIRQRFQKALGSFIGFDGVNNHMGSKFTADPAGMEIVLDELQQRHLFFLDSRTNAKSVGYALARQHSLPTIGRDVFLDDDIKADSIDKQLASTEKVALRKGYAVAIGHPHALTLERLEQWLPDAEKRGFKFVPVRELVYKDSPPP